MKTRITSNRISAIIRIKLAAGVGFNAQENYHRELDFVVRSPLLPGSPALVLANKTHAWGYGWAVGVVYQATKTTIVDASFYSKLILHTKGYSTWGPLRSNNTISNAPSYPNTYSLGVTQFFSKEFFANAIVRYAEWDIAQFLVYRNTALGDFKFIEKYFNTLTVQLGAHYQIDCRWAVLGGLAYNANAVPTVYRSPGYPVYSHTSGSVGAEYTFNKAFKAKFIYGYLANTAPINKSSSLGPVAGHSRFSANLFDFSLTYDV